MVIGKSHIHHGSDLHLRREKAKIAGRREEERWETFPCTATGLSTVACMPRMADCGGLMMGVPNSDPNTPPLEMVNVPPSISSMARVPSLA